MRVGERHYRSIWVDERTGRPEIIDQTRLPHRFETRRLVDVSAAAEAIASMRVRGAPLIGATAAHGLALALRADPSLEALDRAAAQLVATRPTAVNLQWAVDRVVGVVRDCAAPERAAAAEREALAICDADVAACEAIGEHGLALLRERARERGRGAPDAPLRVLTHCNAGWLATVDWGTALAPIYKAFAANEGRQDLDAGDAGLSIHVWVDETRPRNQGASLTAWELREMGVPHAVVVDNAGGYLMQQDEVDLVLVGSDRTTATGDVCNKIGTYLKALAAHDNGVPFYVAVPTSTIDWSLRDGLREIPIEERSADEVRFMSGLDETGALERVALFDEASPVANPAFDVTPSRFVSRLVTEAGVCEASEAALQRLRARL